MHVLTSPVVPDSPHQYPSKTTFFVAGFFSQTFKCYLTSWQIGRYLAK